MGVNPAVTLGLLAALGGACCYGVASVLQAVAARAAGSSAGLDPRLLMRLLGQPPFVASLALSLGGFTLHVVALRSLPLFVAQAVIACSVAVTAVASVRIIGARMRRAEWVAVLGVCLGLLVLGATAGKAGSTVVGRAFHWGLVAAVVLPALIGVVVVRAPGATGALLLGAAGGLGFSIVGVAARVLPTLSVSALSRDPATYALLAAGPLGFLLYATALQRGSATTATAPVVVVETTVPAVVGLLLLGDRTRSGAAVPALCGFLLAVAGSVALARFGEHPPLPTEHSPLPTKHPPLPDEQQGVPGENASGAS